MKLAYLGVVKKATKLRKYIPRRVVDKVIQRSIPRNSITGPAANQVAYAGGATGLFFSGLGYLASKFSKPKNDMVYYKEPSYGVSKKQIVGRMTRKYRAPYNGPVLSRPVVGDSHPGTVGLVRSRYKSDRSDPRKTAKLVNASERYIIWSIRGLNQWNSTTGANRGYHSLANYSTGINADRVYPVHIWNLTAIPQGTALIDYQCQGAYNVNPVVGYTLVQAQGTNAAGVTAMGWDSTQRGVLTYSGNNSSTCTWSVEQISDQVGQLTPTATIGNVGRKHYLDWVDFRMMIYGKRKHDSKVKVQIVRFNQDKFCPEYYKHLNLVNSGYFPSTATADPQEAEGTEVNEYWKGVVHSLVNNPIAPRGNKAGTATPYSVLFTKTFVITGKDTSEANADVNVEMFKFFKRYAWMRDHTRVLTSGQTAAEIQNEFTVGNNASRQDFASQPKKLTDNIYLMISGEVPHDFGEVALTDPSFQDFQPSYDIVIRKKTILDLA